MKALTESLKSNPHRTGLIIAALASVSYGLYPAALRAVYADGGNAILMVVVTTWARALGLTIYCLFKRAKLFQSAEDKKKAFIGGLFQAVSILCILMSLLYISGPLMIIIVFTHTLMLLFFMAWRGEIKLDAANITTTILALFGLTLVLDLWRTHPEAQWIGMALAFIAALATVGRLYVYGHQTKIRNPIAVGAENFLIAAALVLPIVFILPLHLPTTWVGDLYIAASCLSLTLGTFLMFLGISLLGSFQYSLMAKLEPIFTSIFSVLILNEVLSLHQYLGIALVIGSLAAYQLIRRRQLS